MAIAFTFLSIFIWPLPGMAEDQEQPTEINEMDGSGGDNAFAFRYELQPQKGHPDTSGQMVEEDVQPQDDGLGTFSKVRRKARKGRNPQPGE